MDRARRAVGGLTLSIALLAAIAGQAGGHRSFEGTQPVAAVAWPVPTLLVAEVVTGGASASDEYVEIENAGPSDVDLVGTELVYITSSGATVTRKQSWPSSRPLAPGQHLLMANSTGAFAPVADGTYSGGLAATGGAIALRLIGGTVIDAVGWGDAANPFVEGSPTAAPTAGSSAERGPGGARGNSIDTNDNSADWFVQTTPVPQNLAA